MIPGKKVLAAALVLAQFLPAPANAFVLLPGAPISGFVMNLDLGSAQFQTVGYGLTSWSKLAANALDKWNAAGVGSGPDFGFFRTTNPVVASCAHDGINEVRWAPDNCGYDFGSAIAITNRWLVDGVRVEADVIFNSNLAYNAYQGPLVSAANGTEALNDFFRVAEHEFGHVAGLDHPDQGGQSVAAVMNSQISDVDSLQPDDVAGARAIDWSYAGTSTTTTTVAVTTTTTLSPTGKISMQSFFPFQPGYEWTYRDESGGIITDYRRVVGRTPVSLDGILTYVWADTSGVSRYMSNDADGVRRHANGSPGFVTGIGDVTVTSTYSPPELYVPASVIPGGSATQSGTVTQTFGDGSSSTDPYSQMLRFDTESVTVPAGTFAAVRVTSQRTISGNVSTNTFWIVDGMGMVKLQYNDSAGNVQGFSLSSINFAPAPGTGALNLSAGWNLAGNGSGGPLDVTAFLGKPDNIVSVWKWIAGGSRWAFYTPSMSAQALADYAASKGYDVLTTINGGEGYWVNAKTAFQSPLPNGAAVSSTSYQTGLAAGWNLIAIGDGQTPRQFNNAIGPTQAATGTIPANLTSLWTWDAAKAGWYFYAPELDAQGGTVLGDYIAGKNYLDFGAKVLDLVTGFWVNKR